MARVNAGLVGLTGLILGIGCARADAPKPDSQAVEFFEKRIRPVLVAQCFECHSAEAKKLKGKLRLDTREGLRKGGESGAVVVPGQPEQSVLISALRYDGPRMPPKAKLPPEVIADFEKWVAMGAPDPRLDKPTTTAKVIDWPAARKHWSYQPIRRPELPAVRDQCWPASAIDSFILVKLEEAGLTPSPQADKRTLIRRAYFDLIGLPPTFEEVEAFVKDQSPDAFAKVVDRLLASPRYGERWGRHWLDVARYADTKDLVLLFGPDRVRPYAYTYRDYVIRSFNEDTPYDRFIHEQLAADQLFPKVEPWRFAGMGLLTVGRLFDNNLPDIYDDQIDTVSRGFLGLTVSCARCHDHKYDAIPTADYYSLYGVFAGSEAPLELPLIDSHVSGAAEFEKQAAPKRDQLRQHIDKQYEMLTETARSRVTEYLLKMLEKPDPLETAVFFLSLSPDDLRPQILARWRRYLERHAHSGDPVFGPWHDLLQLPDAEFASKAKEVVARLQLLPAGTAEGQINPLVRDALARKELKSKTDVPRTYGELLKHEESKKAGKRDQLARQQLLAILTGKDGPIYFPKSNAYLYMSRVERETYGKLRQELDKMAVTSPGAPPRAMSLIDAPEPYESRVFVRGNPLQLGDKVPRQFPRILGGDERKPFAHGSGRLDLAKAITDPDNPLTARVMVNRVWMHHFGEPLVSTPSDFGTRSTPPSHPELLDHLARSFIDNGWSLKKLHREIMLSKTYQQSSSAEFGMRSAERSSTPHSALRAPHSVDPENRLLWRGNRRRLDLESMRDSMLALSSRLDSTLYGRPLDVAGDPKNRRRTVYGLVDRQDVPGLYRSFDFASPDQTAERRPQTTVPQQALFGMNSPFMIEQAKALAARPEIAQKSAPEQRVAALYRVVLARQPRPAEVELALRFIREAEAEKEAKLNPWEQLAQVLMLTNEMMFVD